MENFGKLVNSAEIGECDLQQKMAEEKVESLQEVLKKLQMTKKFLHLNAVEVKASIHSNISRLLEAMRSREVWLLNQVDVILQAKEDGLRLQEDQLNRAIGQLSNCLSLMDSGAALNSELDDVLRRIDLLGKHPVESPHISFRAEIAGLRQAVVEFGRVDSKGLTLEAFASPHLHSSSLPKPFEDYEDDEHHVFYKSVHEIHEKKHGKSIIFNIPKLSGDIPSWVSPTHTSVGKGNKTSFGNPDKKMDGMKSRPATIAPDHKRPTTAYSVSQWMQEIKMEEEEDELMTLQLSSRYGDKGLVTSASASCLLSGSNSKDPMLQLSKTETLSQLPRNTDSTGEMCDENPKPQLNYFSFLSPRLQDWLIDGDSRLPASKVPEVQPRSLAFEPYVFKPSVSPATKENVLDSYLKKMAALPTEFWLAPTAESAKLESEACGTLLENYVKKISVLPWLISYRGLSKESEKESGSQSQFGIIENYARRIADLEWLASAEDGQVSGEAKEAGISPKLQMKAVEGYLEEYLRSLSSKSWLMAKGDELEEEDKTFFSDYTMKLSKLPSHRWLLQNQEKSSSLLSEVTNTSDDHEDAHPVEEEATSEASSENTTQIGNSAGLDKYCYALNSSPLNFWLLSASTGNPSEPDALK